METELFPKSNKLKTYINPLSCCHTCTCCRGCQYSQQLHELTWNEYKSKQATVMVYLFILRLQVSLASINTPMTLRYFIGLFRINTADQQEGPPDPFSSSEGGVWARDYMRLGWEQDYKQLYIENKAHTCTPTHSYTLQLEELVSPLYIVSPLYYMTNATVSRCVTSQT